MSKPSKPLVIIFAFFSIYVIWGSTYLLNKIAVSELSPFFLAAIRFIMAGLLIFVLAKLTGKSLRVSRKQYFNTAIAGFLFLALGNGIVVWALKYVDSGFAALEISAQPLIVLILMRILQGKKIKIMSAIGVILGIFGIYLLVSQQQVLLQENAIIGILMIFFCLLSWSYGSLFVGKANLPGNYLVNTGYQMLNGGLMLSIFSLIFNEKWISPFKWSSGTQTAMILLILFGSIVAFTSFNYLLKTVSPEKVATSTYVNPLIALILGWYFLDEKITTQAIIAAIVLLTGVYFINSSKKQIILRRFESKPKESEKINA